jgi:hypothetical protein
METVGPPTQESYSSFLDALAQERVIGAEGAPASMLQENERPQPDFGSLFASSPGPGIAMMRERAELTGGRIEIQSLAGAGTMVEAWLPEPGLVRAVLASQRAGAAEQEPLREVSPQAQ